MVDALGSAGTQAAGLWEFNADGAMSKHLHPGKAAINGIIAADPGLRSLTRTGIDHVCPWSVEWAMKIALPLSEYATYTVPSAATLHTGKSVAIVPLPVAATCVV